MEVSWPAAFAFGGLSGVKGFHPSPRHTAGPLNSRYSLPLPPTIGKDRGPIPMSCAGECGHKPSWGNLILSQYTGQRPGPLNQEQLGRLTMLETNSKLHLAAENRVTSRVLTTSVLTAAAELYANRAGITAGAGTRLVLYLLLGG